MTSVLFVCLGNICRSPTAEGVFRQLLAQQGVAEAIRVDSAGTGAWHVGEPPDARAQAAARTRGVDLSKLRARQVSPDDFEIFDHILAMDESNLTDLADLCPPRHRSKLRLFLEFAPHAEEREVPDPYFGGDDGFGRVLDLIEAASRGFLAHLQQGAPR
jgi:protein-tyrosine phosphatase